MALALDGSAHAPAVTASSTTVTLTTTSANDIIYLLITSNAAVSSVSGGGLTWNLRTSVSGSGAFLTAYYAKAASPLSAVTFTITMSASTFVTADIFGISGADQTTIFDSGGPQTTAGAITNITTSNANNFVIGAVVTSGAAGVGWTIIPACVPADFQLSEFQIVSSTGTFSAEANPANGVPSLADAIMQGTGGGGGGGGIVLARPRRIFVRRRRQDFTGWNPLSDPRTRSLIVPDRKLIMLPRKAA